MASSVFIDDALGLLETFLKVSVFGDFTSVAGVFEVCLRFSLDNFSSNLDSTLEIVFISGDETSGGVVGFCFGLDLNIDEKNPPILDFAASSASFCTDSLFGFSLLLLLALEESPVLLLLLSWLGVVGVAGLEVSLSASEKVDDEELATLCLAGLDLGGTEGGATSFNLLDLAGSGDFGTGLEVLF